MPIYLPPETQQKSDSGSKLFSPPLLCRQNTRKPITYSIGDRVRVQDPKTKRWTERATVVGIRKSGRSYVLHFDGKYDDQLTSRNSIFMRPLQEIALESASYESGHDDSEGAASDSSESDQESRDCRSPASSDDGYTSGASQDGQAVPRRSSRERKPIVRFSC